MRRLLALACVLGIAGWSASVAAACHSEVTASIDCSGNVSWTATAWTGPDANDQSRTNNDVRVYVWDSASSSYREIARGQFTKANGFSFSGTFSAGSASSVQLKVQEAAPWGNGDSPAEARLVTAMKSGCSSGGGTTTPSPAQPAPAQPVAPPAAVPAPTITLVKLERAGTAGFTGGPITVKVGDFVAYQMVVTNTGTSTVSVALRDDGCDAGTLAPTGPQAILPGASLTYTCSHKIVAADGRQYVNTALATAENAGPAKATATASVTATIARGSVLGAQTKLTKHVKAKKVTKRAKPARPVILAADFTG